MVFDNLNVRIGASTQDFSRGINSAERSLSGLVDNALEASSSLQVLQNRADEAGDEISGAGRDAAKTSGLFSTLSVSTSGLSFSFGGLATSATTAAVGLGVLTAGATALVSTLFPLAAILGTVVAATTGLVGAFGAIIGTGILAFGKERGEQNARYLKQLQAEIERLEELKDSEEGLTDTQEDRLDNLKEEAKKYEDLTGITGGLKDAFADLKEEIQPIIVDFGQQFIPLVEDAIDALPDFIRNIFDAVGGMDRFVSALRTLGRGAFNTIPRVVSFLTDLGRQALPVFLDGVRWLRENGGQIFTGMLRVTQRLAPVFMNLMNALIAATPELTKLGTVVLERLVPAFTGFIQTVEDIINLGESSDGIVDFIKALVNDALEWIKGPGAATVGNIGDQVLDKITNFLDPGGEGVTNGIIDMIKSLQEGAISWLEGGGKEKIASLVTSLMDTLSNQISQISDSDIKAMVNNMATILGGVFDSLIAAATSKQGSEFGAKIGTLAGTVMKELGGSLLEYAFSDAFKKDMQLLGQAIANTLGIAVIRAIQETISMPIMSAIYGEERARELQRRENREMFRSFRGDTMQQRQWNLNVNVEGDTDVVKSVSAEVLQEKERRIKRDTGRNPSIGR